MSDNHRRSGTPRRARSRVRTCTPSPPPPPFPRHSDTLPRPRASRCLTTTPSLRLRRRSRTPPRPRVHMRKRKRSRSPMRSSPRTSRASRSRSRKRASPKRRSRSHTQKVPRSPLSNDSRVLSKVESSLLSLMTRITALENSCERSSSSLTNINKNVDDVSATGPLGPNVNSEQVAQDSSKNVIASTSCDKIVADTSQNELLHPSDQSSRENNLTTSTSAHDLVEAIKSLKSTNSQNYFVSNFDPLLHDIDVWCKEVERAKYVNGWNEYECLSRVSTCLKGDARIWLNEWVTNDRSWRNFVLEFKPLCPRKLDYASILNDVMQTNSDKFSTYAEYARRSLLRLRIVKGVSEELMISIIVRGITDPQLRAAATNAGLTAENLVSFLSIYVKPGRARQDIRAPHGKKRLLPPFKDRSSLKCFNCSEFGHKSFFCPKKSKRNTNISPVSTPNTPNDKAPVVNKNVCCPFCKKPGHSEEQCFVKNRSAPRNKRNVNLCKPLVSSIDNCNDICSGVVQGVPVDILIDSGAINVSLVSADTLKYFCCERKPQRCTVKGIAKGEVEADSYVTLTVELDEISIEADFVIVPGSCISAPIIIGTDILNRDGIKFVRTKDRQYVIREPIEQRQINLAALNPTTTINTPLQGQQREALMEVVTEFSEYLITGTASTTVKTGKMQIKVTDETPIVYRPYRLSYTEKLKVREMIQELKEKGIIRDSNSEYASPIILVKKKDGTDRMCIDYRALNRLTVRDRYPMPLIDDHIDRLGSFKYFTSLDMATGFYQIPIDEQSIHRTGFVTPEGHYEFLKMPFGLTNSPIVYQRIINETLRSFIDAGNVLVYVDDVLLMSNTVEEGIELLRQVLKTLTDAGFSVNLRKCSFLATSVEYLGRVIAQGQVRPSPHKVAALANASPPQNVKQVRQFLGLAGYFRRYIPGYATKTACISRLTKKNVPFIWGEEQENTRKSIIELLTSEPILTIFDSQLQTELHTDASCIGYGAVLMQTHRDGKRKVVAYFSKTTQGVERKYHSYELETLAVVKALQHFRHYLVGLQFKIVTDCNALKATERKKDLLPRVARWWVYLQDFSFEIQYRKGTMMSHADYLSRNPIVEVHLINKPRNWAQIAQSADVETHDLIQQLQEGRLDSSRYVLQNDILYYCYFPVGQECKLLCYVPKGHRLSLLRIFHDEHEHIGQEKTVDLILKHFWFPGLRKFVAKYIGHCLICISKKRIPRAPHQFITSWEKPDVPFHTLHLDALGPLPQSHGYKFVLLVVDAYTKYCLLYPMYRQDGIELKKALSQAISLFGVPKLLVADRGRMFEARSFVTWLNELGSDIHYITPEMHHSNGQVERYVRTVLNMIRIETNHKDTSWSESLWRLQLVLNMTKQKTTQVSALNLLIGIDGTTPVIRSLIRDVAVDNVQPNRVAWREMCRARAHDLLNKNRIQQDAYVNENRHPVKVFQVGDLVFVIKYSQSTGKLDSGMRGPYRVVRVLPSGRYELRLLTGSYGKTTQAAAEYMVAWRGEWCPESCAAFFDYDEEEITQSGALPSTSTHPNETPEDQENNESNDYELVEYLDDDALEDDAMSGEGRVRNEG